MKTFGKNRLTITFLVMAIATLLFVVVNCQEIATDPDNGETPTASISLDIIGTKPAAVTRGAVTSSTIDVIGTDSSTIGTLTLTDARVVLDEIEFKLEDELDESTDVEDIDFKGPFIVDLLSNTSIPSFSTIVIPAGNYKEIELELDKIQDNDLTGDITIDQSDDLFENSIYLEGTYSGDLGGTQVVDVPFSFSFDLDEEFELSGADIANGMTLEETGINPVIIAFRLAKWFVFDDPETTEDIDFTDLTSVPTSIVLDKDADNDLDAIRNTIKENIKESADYGKDNDDDGELGSDEDDDPDSEDESDD